MRKRIVFIIASCLILKNLIAIGGVQASPTSASAFMENPIFNSVSTLKSPFRMLDFASSQDVPLFPEYKGRTSNEKSSGWPDDSCMNTGSSVKITRANTDNSRFGGQWCDAALRSLSHESRASPPRLRSAFIDDVRTPMLAYCVLLHRSSLPWEIMDNYSDKSPITLERNRAFLVPEKS